MSQLTTQPNGSNGTVALNNRMALPPLTDVYADDGGYTLVADFPGVAQDKLEITFEDKKLTIVGRRSAPNDPGTEQVLRRTFTVSEDVDPDGIAAKLTDGVLTVTLPKKAQLKPRRIAIA